MYRGWLQINDAEIGNSARAYSYIRNGVRNATLNIVTDDSWSQHNRWAGVSWVRPEVDTDCPWYDPTAPESAEFAGVIPVSVEGLDSTPLKREVVESASHGGAVTDPRTPPRVIRVEACLVAATPGGLQYGLGWLDARLRTDLCGVGTAARVLHFLDSAPLVDDRLTDEQIQADAGVRARQVVGTVLTEGLSVEELFSPWIGEYRGATCARVSWEWTATVPWVWHATRRMVTGLRPATGSPVTASFERVDADGHCPASCDAGSSALVDPMDSGLMALPRPVSPLVSSACTPVESRRLTWWMSTKDLPRWGEALPTVTVRTGATAERGLRLRWVQGTDSVDKGCSVVGEAMVTYLPANCALVLDARTGHAWALLADGKQLDATGNVVGREGGPWRAPVMKCGKDYTLVIDTPRVVDTDLQIDVDVSVRQP